METIPRAAWGHDAGLAAAVYLGIRTMCVPLARLAMRFGFTYDTVCEALKSAFVQAAQEEYSRDGRPPSDTEIQVASGIPRKAIPAIRMSPRADAPTSFLAQVLGVWTSDDRFRRAAGKPLDLPFRAVVAASFHELVKRIGKDLSPKAVLDLMLADGIVEMTAAGNVRLAKPVTATTKNAHAVVSASCNSVTYQFETFLQNLKLLLAGKSEQRRFNQKRYSEGIPLEMVGAVDRRVRRVLERADDEVRQILDETEVSRETVGVVLMGAGFYSFVRSKNGRTL